MCYVPVDVHGGGDTVFGDVFVAVRIRFTVDRVDTGNRNSLLPQSYVAVNGAVTGYGLSTFSKSRQPYAETLAEKKSTVLGSQLLCFAS